MKARQEGYTLIEVMVVVTALLPILAVIGSMGAVVTKTINANDRGAELTNAIRTTVQRISGLLRPAKLSTFQIRSTAQDVTLLRAATVGEWISPTDLEPRQAVRFLAAEGLLSMNAILATPPRELRFERDATELPNGIDDDGDGMVDEGRLELLHDTTRVVLARDLEACDFTLDGRILRITLGAAKRDAQGNVYRGTVRQSFYIRNN